MLPPNKIKWFLPVVLMFIAIGGECYSASGLSVGAQPCGKRGCHPLTNPPIHHVPAKTHIQKKHHKWVNRGKHTYRTPKK